MDEQNNLPLPPKDLPEPQKLLNPPTFGEKYLSSKWYLLVLITILVFIFGGYYFFGETVIKTILPTNNPTPSPVVTTAPDPTADWMTYANEELGFSVEYPLSDQNRFYEHSWGISMTDCCPEYGWVTIEAVDTKLSPQAWWENVGQYEFNGEITLDTSKGRRPEAFKTTLSTENINGVDVLVIDAEPSVAPTPERIRGFERFEKNFKLYIFQGKNRIYIVDLHFGDDSEFFQRVLSSFKLLDSLPSPSAALIDPQEQVVCTMDAKLCPDGSSVGRSGPNCEFAPCP